MKIRVMIVDDHQIVNDGIYTMLKDSEDLEVVARCSNGREAIERVEFAQPNVILMDISMPEVNGIEATREIKLKHPNTQVLILTMFAEDKYVSDAIMAGASGYLLKTVRKDDLIKHIMMVHKGGGAVDSKLTKTLFDAVKKKRADDEILSQRELQVLQLVCSGKTNNEIAAELFLSVQTVKSHLKKIFEKLDVRDRAQAVAVAMRKNIVT